MPARLLLSFAMSVSLTADSRGDAPPERPANAVDVLCFAADRPLILRFHLLLDGDLPKGPLHVESPGENRSGNRSAEYFQTTAEPDGGQLFGILDADKDDRLSKSERQRIAQSLRKFDLDDDETISTAELDPLSNPFVPIRTAPREVSPAKNLLVPISAQSRRALAKQVIERYTHSETAKESVSRLMREELGLPKSEFQRSDADGNGSLDFNELAQWLRRPSPTVKINVSLNRRAGAVPIEITDSGDKLQATVRMIAANTAFLTIGNQQVEIEIDSASPGDRIVLQVGAEARNLFEMLDLNSDRRLSIRELRSAVGRIDAWDQDGDTGVSRSEIPKPARLTFRRPASIGQSAEAASAAVPGWFAMMDSNGDGDLSHREFLGRREHFRTLDANGDDLIDAQEASAWQSTEAGPESLGKP